jgi:hypothetical protein
MFPKIDTLVSISAALALPAAPLDTMPTGDDPATASSPIEMEAS